MRLGRRALLWLVPLFVTLHNLEELAGLSPMLIRLSERVPQWVMSVFPKDVFPPNYRQYLLMLVIVTVLPYSFTILNGARKPRGLWTGLLAGTQMVMFINVFSHLGQMFWFKTYVPGLATALMINLPFSLLFFHHGLRVGWVRWQELGYLFLLAFVLHSLGLFGLFWVVRAFVNL